MKTLDGVMVIRVLECGTTKSFWRLCTFPWGEKAKPIYKMISRDNKHMQVLITASVQLIHSIVLDMALIF